MHARQRFEWGLTASVCAIVANTAPQGKNRRRTFKPDDFSPYSISGREEQVTFKDMLKMLAGGRVAVKG